MSNFDTPTPSAIAIEAIRADGIDVKPILLHTAPIDTQCMACGSPIPEGTPCNTWEIQTTFNDIPHLKNRNTGLVCQDCSVTVIGQSKPKGIMNKLILQKHVVYSREGTRVIGKRAAFAHCLLNPPNPPFVMTYGTAKQQHLVWKAPVSYSKEYFFIQYGNTTWPIRRQVIINAKLIIEQLRDLMVENDMKVDKSKTPMFVNTSFDLSSENFGQFRDDVLNLAFKNEQVHLCIKTLKQLKFGELWAALLISVFEPDASLCTPIQFKHKS